MPSKMRIDIALEWFVHDETPASLVMLYFEELDILGHVYGTENTIVSILSFKIVSIRNLSPMWRERVCPSATPNQENELFNQLKT